MIKPSPYLTEADGLYLLSHHLEINEAKAMIKNEFNILNHETLISTQSSLTFSTYAFTIPLSRSILLAYSRFLTDCSSLK